MTASGSKLSTRPTAGEPLADQTTESRLSNKKALTVPPVRGSRRAIASGPREDVEGRAPPGACLSPLRATTASVSAIRRCKALEARSQREGPVGLATRYVERLCVVPFQDRDVEQVDAQTYAIASQRIPLQRKVVIVRLGERHFLSLVPRESGVVKDESFHRRQTNGQRAEI